MPTNTITFIENQILKTKDTLDKIEDKLKDFKLKNPNLEIFDKDFGTYFQKQKTETNISEYRLHLNYYQELLSYLQNSNEVNDIISPSSIGISNPELNSLISNFISLNSKIKELELSTTKSHPKYQSILSQISFTKEYHRKFKKSNFINKIWERTLQNRVNDFNKEIKNLPDSEKKYVKAQ